MVTTIQLDEEVKEQLAAFARSLEQELKERFTYNDVIKYLLEFVPIKQDKKQLNLLRGIISIDKAEKSLRELEDLEKRREKNLNK